MTLALLEGFVIFASVVGSIVAWGPYRLGDGADLGAVLTEAVLLAGCCGVAFYYNDLYDLRAVRSLGQFIPRLVQGLGFAMILLAAAYALFPGMRLTDGPFLSSLALIVGLVLPVRATGYAVMRHRAFADRVLILGTGPLAGKLIAEIEAHPWLGYAIVGVVDDGRPSENESLSRPLLGPLHHLGKIAEELAPDRIIVAMAERRDLMPVQQLLEAEASGILVEDGLEIYEQITGKLAIESLTPSHLLFSKACRKSRLQLGLRRLISLVAAVTGLVAGAPLMLLSALAIKLDSRGPVFFVQERGGRGGRPFRLLKFRTMTDTAPSEQGVWRRDDGKRVTRVGRWLRRLRLDEWPQFWNVLKGDMDFVGPRPEMMANVQTMTEEIPYYAFRHIVRPGITGWAQIQYSYSVTLEEVTEKARYDLYYIKHMSVWLDLRILIDTVKTVLRVDRDGEPMILAEIGFWMAGFLIAYTYLLYPLLLFTLYAGALVRRDLASLRSGRDRTSQGGREQPAVSLIVPAHNEERHLQRKLANVEELDYPRDRLDVIFVSDGSTDGTNAILAGAPRDGTRVILLDPRRGKFSALNAGVGQARHDILVFSDAATEFAPDALRNLARHFADRTVGVVCGALRFRTTDEAERTEGVYWTYECALRLMEARLGATLTASGAIYAVRRECFRPLTADDILDDFVIPMHARRLGYRVVFDPDAEAVDYAGATVKDEFRRRVRLAVGSFRALADFMRVPMSGTTRLAFVSHKLLRWTLPFVMIALIAANACLLSRPVYQVTMAGQLLFYSWATLGFLSRGRGRTLPGALLAYFLVAMNAAFLVGFFKFMAGRREAAWPRVG